MEKMEKSMLVVVALEYSTELKGCEYSNPKMKTSTVNALLSISVGSGVSRIIEILGHSYTKRV